jgi:hypothetical protein
MATSEVVAVVSRIEARRRELRSAQGCRFVDTTTFVDLLVAPRLLQRANDPAARVRGLLDPAIGVRFLIEEEKLIGRDASEDAEIPRLAIAPRHVARSR